MQKNITEYISLRTKLILLVISCWFIPMVVVFSMLAYDISQNYKNRVDNEFITSINHSTDIASIHLDQIIDASREASRQENIKQAYKSYTDSGSLEKLVDLTHVFLNRNFRYDDKSTMAVISYKDVPIEPLFTFNSRQGGSHESYKFYTENIHSNIEALSETLDTRIGFYSHENRIYLVRNIVDESFNSYATIVVELNMGYIFELFNTLDWIGGYRLYLSGVSFSDENSVLDYNSAETFVENHIFKNTIQKDGLTFYGDKVTNDIKLRYIVEASQIPFHELLSDYSIILFITIIFLMLLLLVIVKFSYSNIFTPINHLTDATRIIEGGEFGYQINEDFKNKEFFLLRDSVNHMSSKLDTQFQQIYSEELALRDAKIMALQSQINPHFLNNTLEIINWEARLEGRDNISRMIESLSTMLHAATDRHSEPLITLKRELDYVESYLYILSERFGNKLEISQEIMPNTLNIKVPRLILQPIIENAIEHGLHFAYTCKISVGSYLKDNMLHLKIKNNSPLSVENRKTIDGLLSSDKTIAHDLGKMGIYNVNERLKIIYGETAELSIVDDKNNTTAEIKIPLDNQ